MPEFSPDLPELRLLAQFGGVAPVRMARAYSDPERFFEHMTVEEFQRLQEALNRLEAFLVKMAAAVDVYIKTHRKES